MNWGYYGWCVLGIVISVLLPVLSASVRTYFPAQKAGPAGILDDAQSVWTAIKPYFILGLFSGLTAIIVVFALGDQIADVRAALLAGYAWDSTLQKLAKS